MTSLVGKYVFGKMFKETAANRFGKDEDPYFEVPAENLSKAGKRRKRQKKALPPGITEEEGLVLTKVKRRAYRIDMCFGSFLGLKVGWGGVIGIIPVIGDVLDALLCLIVMKTALALSLPSSIKFQMLLNIVIDFAVGLIPFVGDLADVMYKASTRNAILLEKYLRAEGAKRLKGQGVDPTTVEDPSLPERYDSGDEESQIREPERAHSKRHRDPEKDAVGAPNAHAPTGSAPAANTTSEIPERSKSKKSSRHKSTYR